MILSRQAAETNPDSQPISEPALELQQHGRVTLPFQRIKHWKQFRRRADHKKVEILL